MRLGEFDYHLPEELIAQKPAAARDASRLMVVDRNREEVRHGTFTDLPGYLEAGDVLVINDTEVYPARIEGVKKGTGGALEALVLKRRGDGSYEALVKGRLPVGAEATFGGRLDAVVEEDLGAGKKLLRFGGEKADVILEEIGCMPLPPYIKKYARDEHFDRQRYQTVYASRRGAVAAPTAGLHFTEELLGRIKGAGVVVAPVTLHVGMGTFMPIREEVLERHVMEVEDYEVPRETARAVNAARSAGKRVIAVGTTSVRAIESAAAPDGTVTPVRSGTGLFIRPGYAFKVVDALVTNFHLPKSTLLMLVCALAGREKTLSAYALAVREKYRFYSYGDAMLIL